MRNRVWGLLASCAAIVLSATMFSACSDTPGPTNIKDSVTVIVNNGGGTGTGNNGTPSFVITPSGGNLTVNVGQTITVSSCKDASGNAATCTGSSITSNSSSITVSGLTITCTAVGATGTITVTTSVNGTQVSQTSNTFTCVAGTTSGVTGVTVSPNGGTYTLTGSNGVCQNMTIPFSATVSPASASQAVTWTTSGGSINSSGVLTVSALGTYSVKATSVADPSKSFTSTITVNANCGTASNGSISFNPSSGTFTVGTAITLTASCVSPVNCSGATWSSNNTAVATVTPTGPTATLACVSAGTATITVTSGGQTFSGTFTCTSTTATISPTGPINLGSGTGCTNTFADITSNVPMNWVVTSGYGLVVLSNVTSTGVRVTSVPGASGTAVVTATPQSGGTAIPITVNVSNASCNTGGTLVVTPNPLNIVLPNTGTLSAYFNGNPVSATWVSTLNCVTFPSGTVGSTITVQPNRACRDSVVAMYNGAQAFSIVNVTSGALSCIWSNADGTNVYNNYTVGNTSQGNGSCTGTTLPPYWYSKDPSRFSVVGAPYACTISGVVYPCGPTASIKAVYYGSTDVCVQAAVQDPTVYFCRTLSTNPLTKPSGDLVPDDRASVELDVQKQLGITWPNHAAPRGAKLEKITPMADYYESVRKAQAKKP